MQQTKKLHPAIAALIVIVLVGVVASAVITVNNNKGDETSTSQGQSTTAPVKATESTDTSSYEDGTYDAIGSYISPGGRESINLTVTIKNGVIADTSIRNNATDAEALQYQEHFSENYKELIVGKKISEVASLSRVAGSSLTSNGFNDALDKIKDEARA